MRSQPDILTAFNDPYVENSHHVHRRGSRPSASHAGRTMSAFDQAGFDARSGDEKAMSCSKYRHPCWTALSILIVVTASSLHVRADTRAQSECLGAAIKQYKMQSIEFSKDHEQRSSLETIEDVVVRRRLEEAYCTRLVECIEPSPALRGPRFSLCLDLEAEERLRHVTK